MLSKYFWDKNHKETVNVEMEAFISALIVSLEEKHDEVRIKKIAPGGTLGIFFELYIGEKRKFVKTHQCGDTYKENLIKEVEIMSLVYGDVIEIERVDIKIRETQMVFVIMDYLFSFNYVVRPQEVKNYINNYQIKLYQEKVSRVGYSFSQIVKAGEEASGILYEKGFFSKEMYLKCEESLQRIRNTKYQKRICHGDLSNANIMYTVNRVPIVVDWEDSLIAFQEYDYLYWLTFFSQRKFYASGLLEGSGIDKIWGTDIMVLITIIKSMISYKNESYRKNRISFQDRINEIYDMVK